MSRKPTMPKIMEVIAFFISETLIKKRIEEHQAIEIAADCACSIMDSIGGGAVYIPKGTIFKCQERDFELMKDFNRLSIRGLCKKYNITKRRVYQIVASFNCKKNKGEHYETNNKS